MSFVVTFFFCGLVGSRQQLLALNHLGRDPSPLDPLPPSPGPPTPLPPPRSSKSLGGGSLGQHKNFCYGSQCCCVGDCVVRHCHLYPFYSWQDILLAFAEIELDSTTMFIPGTNIMFIRTTGEPVLAQVVGYSEHGDAYCRISCERAATVFFRFAVTFLWLKMCLYGGSAVPHGGWGTVTWQLSPRRWQGVAGDRPPWGGAGQGGG